MKEMNLTVNNRKLIVYKYQWHQILKKVYKLIISKIKQCQNKLYRKLLTWLRIIQIYLNQSLCQMNQYIKENNQLKKKKLFQIIYLYLQIFMRKQISNFYQMELQKKIFYIKNWKDYKNYQNKKKNYIRIEKNFISIQMHFLINHKKSQIPLLHKQIIINLYLKRLQSQIHLLKKQKNLMIYGISNIPIQLIGEPIFQALNIQIKLLLQINCLQFYQLKEIILKYKFYLH
ncbi:hypothetical protein IMG5_098960 [Ichthyophthirius multifiliis]|uniref:Uncharacterized protein n=1 Tax=Ichthyophthirius multifiliis TaxID=5932 RepID=G0QS30_ICHMU|nr:hypothetical protein IMG5_098960 [Ichthyophthirius multifiliis]EGR31972.1 hypothetical protein IMG5_098960 [Ichthyophthirius multifiliis]|eukprot:XP_004035458.1 hypothetical protein IMG5_098960 [Ichthyophthirius multifiliis]